VQKPARRRRHGEQHRVHNHRLPPVPLASAGATWPIPLPLP
jgi:hypothetical protein